MLLIHCTCIPKARLQGWGPLIAPGLLRIATSVIGLHCHAAEKNVYAIAQLQLHRYTKYCRSCVIILHLIIIIINIYSYSKYI